MFGYQTSMINYDTIANGMQGSMNLFWNQASMHSSVYPSLFMYPSTGFGGFTPYSQNWLLDPGFALNNAFNQFGMTCPWLNNGGYTSGGSSAKTEEEFEAEESRKELGKIIDELKKSGIISEAEKRRIDNACTVARNEGEDLVGQYEAYKAKFDEIISTKETRIQDELLEEGDKLKIEDDLTAMKARQNIGIGDDLADTIPGEDVFTLGKLAEGAVINSNNVIKYIEEFQNQNGQKIFDKVNSSTNYPEKEKALNNLATTLKGKARATKSKLDDNSKIALQNAIDNLENCGSVTSTDSSCTVPSGFKDAFETLYAMTRIAEATCLDAKINAKFGKYSDVFNSNIYTQAVVEDLRSDNYNADFTATVNESYTSSDDEEDLTPEERQARREQTEATRINNLAHNNALGGLDLFDQTTVTVNIGGENVTLTKLTPSDAYEHVNSDAKTYYYNPATGKYTEADSAGNYNAAAAEMDLEGFKQTFEDWNFSGENCLEALINSTTTIEDIDDDGFEIRSAYNHKTCHKRVVYNCEEGGATTQNTMINGINTLVDTIKNTLLGATPIDANVLNRAADRVKEYYAGIKEKIETTDADTKMVTETYTEGRVTKERKLYAHIEEDWDKDKNGRVEDQTDFDPKIDSGISVIYDNDGDVSWDVHINTHVLVKKFEYYLAQELASARGE